MFKFILSLILFFPFLSAFTQTNSKRAGEFLNSLDSERRNKIGLPFDHKGKTNWHFLPGTMFPRAGISLKELDPHQEKLLFQLIETSLSETAYQKSLQIIELEKVLAELSGNTLMRDPENYYTAFYGNPKKDSIWAWSFEGHHLSLNFTIANGKMSASPRFMGANPATIPSGKRKDERTLSDEEDLGFDLINAMSEDQKQKAILKNTSYNGILTVNKIVVEPFPKTGIKLTDLNSSQKEILFQLIDTYLSNMTPEMARQRSEKLKKEEWKEISFAWAGATSPGKPHYYRIQGKSFLIEFDNSQNQANHIHSVWRDFDGDFGRDLIREHYQTSHHH